MGQGGWASWKKRKTKEGDLPILHSLVIYKLAMVSYSTIGILFILFVLLESRKTKLKDPRPNLFPRSNFGKFLSLSAFTFDPFLVLFSHFLP